MNDLGEKRPVLPKRTPALDRHPAGSQVRMTRFL